MRKVFFVDDEPLIAQGLATIVDWQNYDLHVSGSANDGVQALERLREDPVDLLITDIMMPRMNGLELIKKVKEMHPRTKFIVLSGYEEFEYVKVGITLGIQNYILKPISIEELEATIKHIRGDWEREELSRFRSEEDWRILRSNILQRWVNGDIKSSELKQRAELLGIPLNYASYQVYVLRLISDERPVSQLYRLTSLADECSRAFSEVLGGDHEVICFPDADDDIVVMSAARNERRDTEQEGIRNAMARLRELTGLRIWCSEGNAGFNDFKDIQASYRKAKDLFNACLIAGDDMLLYSPAAEPEAVQASSPSARPDTFAKLLIEGDIPSLQAYIESVLSGDGKEPVVPRETSFNAAVQLMVAAKDMEKNPDYSEVFTPMHRINTLQGLRNHVWRIVERSLARLEEAEQGYSPHVSFLVEQVQHHYPEELSLKTLSQRLQMHPNYLGQLFQQEVGASFSDYLNQYRIEKATQLLLHTDQKTADIALGVGYTDSSYFYRQFKKYTGVSPTEMRSMYRI
ncbi:MULTISPECIES: response regulator transcription factor [Paenibacillus]|uniref:response regulator transcription factor n=1 Tax=Paenibacillus TaxID=44249 RepID=UPI001B1E7F8B|nr:response regulator transcription factor [Paenibacillus lactis]MCM3497634.1 response regulator transcription factor [Paenibacillus lactis]GIO93868.1 DNA-binding response regulator [Paenibacillus lactis]